jgi:hypothetical protein
MQLLSVSTVLHFQTRMELAMIRILGMTAGMVVTFATATFAQTAPPTSIAPGSSEIVQTQDHLLFTNLRQQPVYAPDNAGLGEIDDLLMERNGVVNFVIVNIGRGGAPKRVAIPMSALDFQKPTTAGAEPRSMKIFLKMSRDELAKAPMFNAYDGK